MASPKIREQLDLAGYRIHQPQHVGRCGKCVHAQPGRKQHGRNCARLSVPVVTHGVCRHFVAGGVA